MLPVPAAPLDRESIENHLEKVLASGVFAGSRRLQKFLRWAAERVLENEADQIKEYRLGVEVFERGADFEPCTDSIVRVEASRLRHKLREYYAGEGRGDALRIELPKGSYVPVFLSTSPPEPVVAAPAVQAVPAKRSMWHAAGAVALATLLLFALGLGIRGLSHSKTVPAPAPGPNCIAVLPFLNLSGDPADDRLADGLVEELTNSLARLGELRVVARRSAFQFKGKPLDVRRIGEQLQVGSILEGSLRRDGARLELDIELVSTTDGYNRWSNRFQTSLGGLYAAEDEILMGVLRAIKVTPKAGLEAVLHRGRPPDPEAHRLYLEARFFWNQRTYEAIQRGIALYDEALRIDPEYALAEAGLAQCYGVIAANGLADTQSAAAKGKRAAEKALAIDGEVADAYAALGLIQSVGDWDWQAAEESFQRALALNPNDANAWQWRAHNFLWQGRFQQAHQAIQKALDLDSLSLVILSNQAEFAYFTRNYEEAVRLYDRTLAIDPGFISANIERGMALDRLHRYDEAVASFEKARTLTQEEASPLIGLAEVNAHRGRTAEARRILSALEHEADRLHVSSVQFAIIYASLGETDRAIAALEKAYAGHESFLIQLKVHPGFDPLRRDPRFRALQRKMRLD